MIDIIIPVCGEHYRLNRILLSILLQKVCDKINVYIIDNTGYDYSFIINTFSKKINLKVIKVSCDYSLSRMKQFGLDSSNSEYIMFMSIYDFMYNCFSVSSLLDIHNKNNCDVVYGNEIVEHNGVSERYCRDNLLSVTSKMFRRDFLNLNNICFNNTEFNEDCGFYGMCVMLASNIMSCDSYVNYHVEILEDIEIFDYIKTFVDNKIYAARLVNNKNVVRFLLNSLDVAYRIYIDNIDDDSAAGYLEIIKPLEEFYIKYKKLE